MPMMNASLKKEASATSTDRQSLLPKTPAHQAVYTKMRDAVLFGDLAPGQPITIQGLTTMLNAGMTPVREAIRKLTAEGALEMQGNRRASVPVLDLHTLEQLEFMRLNLEPELAFRATSHISDGHIAQLTQIDDNLNNAIAAGDISGYLRLNHAFHTTLYAIAQAPILAQSAGALWLRFGPSLRVVCGRFGTSNLPDKHAELLDALKQGNAEAARAATAEDILQGMIQVRAALSEDAAAR
ncbi:DNA-binding transcriptional regulator, GntR family [Pseudosulfitobacter pseudonitzschiae]|uniref:GntR family transcriptional regulator n=2 Tax=Pseudosulfitobacter pseudonitzschiae TaxID=1402135 RepID=UPI0009167B68|nr:DNA-binding transcriptional regulator, GntR family [Pseudosulfitobacter pseudonitzschiae]